MFSQKSNNPKIKSLLETKRLIVQCPTLDQLEHCVKLHMDSDVRKLMYTKAKDADEVRQWLEASIHHYEKFGFTVGCVYEKATGHFIGRAGLLHIEGMSLVEADCYLLKPYWCKGYGNELLQAFFQWGFKDFAIEKIIATVYPININAKMLAEKAGMQYKGLREYHSVDFLWYEIVNEMVFNR
jgi:ribosomal-protein-alanine N-acetyltransferase